MLHITLRTKSSLPYENFSQIPSEFAVDILLCAGKLRRRTAYHAETIRSWKRMPTR